MCGGRSQLAYPLAIGKIHAASRPALALSRANAVSFANVVISAKRAGRSLGGGGLRRGHCGDKGLSPPVAELPSLLRCGFGLHARVARPRPPPLLAASGSRLEVCLVGGVLDGGAGGYCVKGANFGA